MNGIVLLTCLGIALARILDVSLGTLRTVFVIQGRRYLAWALGFFEILIWLIVASKVFQNLTEPWYAVAFALGYASGNALGITFEKWLAFGDQVIRIYTHEGEVLAAQLRTMGFQVAAFHGDNNSGPIDMLFIEAPRRKTAKITASARACDPDCFYIIDDVREVSQEMAALYQPTGWRAIVKKK